MSKEIPGYIQTLREAEHAEVLRGEDLLVHDLTTLLDKQALEDGVRIDFGGDRVSFERALEALGLQERIDRGVSHIHSPICIHGAMTSFDSLAREALARHPLTGALPILQMDRVLANMGGRISVPTAEAKLIIGSVVETEQGAASSSEEPFVELSARYVEEPFVDMSGEGLDYSYTSAQSVLEDLMLAREADGGALAALRRNPVGVFADYLADTGGVMVRQQSTRYKLAIGGYIQGFGYTIDNVGTKNQYTVQAGRVVPLRQPSRPGIRIPFSELGIL